MRFLGVKESRYQVFKNEDFRVFRFLGFKELGYKSFNEKGFQIFNVSRY
jgi:hypothetical protein